MADSRPVIRNHFATVNGRRMHYRQAGEGPVVVMLHASPNSAKVMDRVQAAFAVDFCTIAVDLPGYGLSDPLPLETIATADLADAILGLLDVLDIDQAAYYGRHTGAGVAVEIARRAPERASMVLTDGFPVFASAYSEERLEEYLGSIDPKWDGSHLMWIWSRYRDLFIFWPWDKRTAASRADTELPGPDHIHRGALEFMESGNEFRKVYASAFRYPGLKIIDQVKVPVCFGNRPGDSQYRTMSQYPPEAWQQEFPRDTIAAAVRERQILHSHPARAHFSHPDDDFRPGKDWPDVGYVDTSAGRTLVRARGSRGEGRPVLLLHDLPGSSALHLPLLEALGEERHALAIDLMGQGESSFGEPGAPGPEAWSRQIAEIVEKLQLGAVDLIAVGTSAAAAVEFALARPELVESLVMVSPPVIAPSQREKYVRNYPVSADPEWDGGHLPRVFHHLRDQQLWFPWFDRTTANIRKNDPLLDPHELHLKVRECVKQPRNYRPVWEAVLSYPLPERLSWLKVRTSVASAPADVFAPVAPAAADHARAGEVIELSDDPKEQAGKLLRFPG